MKKKSSLKHTFIDKELYGNILQIMPITCVDLLLINKNNFLLGKRKNKPLKDRWCFPGGRILKGESLMHTIYRKAKEEVDLKKEHINSINFLTVKDVFYPDSPFGSSVHNVNIIFKVAVVSVGDLKPDDQHQELRWFSKIDKKWPLYVRQVLESDRSFLS